MNRVLLVIAIGLTIFSVTAKTTKPFTGTWCIGGERLVIEFVGTDSIHISSKADASINGRGVYTKNDTAFTASLLNDGLSLKMGYRYEMKSSDKIKAKITFFTVDGDSVNHPRRWLRMSKCDDPEKFDFEAAEKEDAKLDANSNEGKK